MEQHHNHREPGTGADRTRLTQEQEDYARVRIERGIDAASRSGDPIDSATARLIAAALHPGFGSHLEQFAATGVLNAAAALDEIGGAVDLHQVPWIAALWDYLEQLHAPHPDRAPIDYEEPTPAVFIQANDPQLGLIPCGTWVEASRGPESLRAEFDAVLGSLDVEGASVGITAAVGFHGLALPFDATPKLVHTHAVNIIKHGEPYALLAEQLGTPVSDREFLLRFRGAYPSLTEFMAAQPAELLAEIRSSADASPDLMAYRFDEFERFLRRTFLCLQGKSAVYIFLRSTNSTGESL
ncbi:MAG: hypothetical protein J0I18_07175 [Actinobacteria bacterium]|nr:hypothetical protein [Actinomycetota bacterium]